MAEDVIEGSGCVFADLGIDKREAILRRWDTWRAYIKGGGGASWPRDEFEALIDGYEEEVQRLRDLEEGRSVVLPSTRAHAEAMAVVADAFLKPQS